MDGDVEFLGRTEAELLDVLRHIDTARYPKNFQKLCHALEARGYTVTVGPTGHPQATRSADLGSVASSPRVAGQPALTRDFASPVGLSPTRGPFTWLEPARNTFRLVGRGNVSVSRGVLTATAWRYALMFGVPSRQSVDLDLERIVNVEKHDAVVRLEYPREGESPHSLIFWFDDERSAQRLVDSLPTAVSSAFEPRLVHHLEFETHASGTGRPELAAALLVVANCAMFLWALYSGAALLTPSGATLIKLGSSYAPFMTAGDWWRAISGTFLHAGAVHLAFNMWALGAHGPLLERLLGSISFAWLYLVAGTVGALASAAWAPDVNSVGASGPIFGVLGALLVSLWRTGAARQQFVVVPLMISASSFVAVALVGGLLSARIDNAAHLGGLGAGAVLGCLLPLRGVSADGSKAGLRAVAAIVASIAAVAGLAATAVARADTLSGDVRLAHVARWIELGEHRAVQQQNLLFEMLRSGSISAREFADRLSQSAVPFWTRASDDLAKVQLPPDSEYAGTLEYMRRLAESRKDALAMCVRSGKDDSGPLMADCIRQIKTGNRLKPEQP